jgi:hypothetical protein
MRYSYVIEFPNGTAPFDKPEFRWPSFLGEFVAPLVQNKSGTTLQFWFTYYVAAARFRVLLGNCPDFEQELMTKAKAIGLNVTDDEKQLTVEDDLGASRFILQTKPTADKMRRAMLVLRFLHATSALYLDCLRKRPDGYWEMEPTPDKENPLGNNFESLAHLLGNISQFEFDVFTTAQTVWDHNAHLISRVRARLW